MKIHNELSRGLLSKALKNAVSATKSEGGLERFGETLTPVIDLWLMPEWAFLRAEKLWAAGVTQPAVAAEFSGAAVVNPVNSGLIVVVENVSGQGSATNLNVSCTVTLAAIQASYALTILAQSRDTRAIPDLAVVGAPPTPVQIWSGTDPASFAGIRAEKFSILAGAPSGKASSPPFVLKPGAVLHVEATTVNLGVDFNFSGRVRQAFVGEL